MSVRARLQASGPYVLGGSILVLEQFSKVAELIPSPFVKPVVELALGILNVVQVRNGSASHARPSQQGVLTQGDADHARKRRGVSDTFDATWEVDASSLKTVGGKN